MQDSVTTIDSGDTAWMIVATALVLLMTLPGLALLYAGMGLDLALHDERAYNH